MGGSSPHYTPLSKPTVSTGGISLFKKSKLYPLALLTILCSLSYLFGAWHNAGPANPTVNCFTTSRNTTTEPHPSSSSSNIPQKLDFSTHHTAENDVALSAEAVKAFPPCDMKYSEYTPCEDQERSLKFERSRLIYRERHCPEKKELLKCRVPAPHGYQNPFKWPLRRDLAWYANVTHKELTVEKAVQNWIRFEGDPSASTSPAAAPCSSLPLTSRQI